MYLLSTGALLEFIQHQPMRPGPFRDFLDGITPRELAFSVVSIGQLRHAIELIPSHAPAHASKPALQNNLRAVLSRVQRFNQVFPVDLDIVNEWVVLLALDLRRRNGEVVGPDSRLVLATAMHHGWTLVDTPEPYLPQLQRLGMACVSPF